MVLVAVGYFEFAYSLWGMFFNKKQIGDKNLG